MNRQRLEFCKQTMGVDETIVPGDRVVDDLRRATDGNLPDVVIDATGNNVSMSNAFGYLAPTGRLVYVGITTKEVTFTHPTFHRPEGTLLASRNASMAAVPLDGCAPTRRKVSSATRKIAHLRTIGIVLTSETTQRSATSRLRPKPEWWGWLFSREHLDARDTRRSRSYGLRQLSSATSPGLAPAANSAITRPLLASAGG